MSLEEDVVVIMESNIEPHAKARLVIQLVARGMGKRGGRPRANAEGDHNPLGTGSEPVTNPFTAEGSSILESDPVIDPSKPDKITADQRKPLLVFPVTRGAGKSDTWGLCESHVAILRSGYPALDVLGECRRALVWVQANPGNRKTASGMMRFLANWLARAQNNGSGRNGSKPAASVTAPYHKPLPRMTAEEEARVKKSWGKGKDDDDGL